MRRRSFLQTASLAGTAPAFLGSLPARNSRAEESSPADLLGQAEHCIMIWLGGGMAQIDTFDPKKQGDAKADQAGSYYPSIETSVPGVKVCEHLQRTAGVMEHVTAMRTVFHDVVNEHAAATNRMHTGRPTSGTVQYPSLGSIIAHERGAVADGVPAYMLIGYPNLTRGPGFLGQQAGYVYLTDIEAGPAGLARPRFVSQQRQARREALLDTVRASARDRMGDDKLFNEYDAAISESLRLAGPNFMNVFDLSTEPDSLRQEYGMDFGQRLLLARRLCDSGVRFVEVSHNMNFRNGTGWDTHNEGQLNQHLLIEELDIAFAALIKDLRQRGTLDKTLLIINSEFGRPANFDSGGGRGHHSSNFTVVLAGGGLNHAGAYGESDELAMNAVDHRVSVPDLFATVFSAMQIDPTKNLYDGDRPVPITDQGKAIRTLLG